MKSSKICLTTQNNIAILKINNPDQLNSLNSEIIKEMEASIDKLKVDKDVRVLIITGEGKAFVAGADISEMKNFGSKEGQKFGELGSRVFRKIETLPFPVIAAVNGFALGGGCELALACDMRVASEKAKFGQPEVGLGITPGFSGTQRLPRLIGLGKAKELIFTGSIISADEALKIGLVNYVTAPEDLLNKCMELASVIASKAPIAVKYSKEAINIGIESDIDSGIETEIEFFAGCFNTEDQKTGMSSFLEKSKPEFKNK